MRLYAKILNHIWAVPYIMGIGRYIFLVGLAFLVLLSLNQLSFISFSSLTDPCICNGVELSSHLEFTSFLCDNLCLVRPTPPVMPNVFSRSGGVRMSLPTTLSVKPGAYCSIQENTGEYTTIVVVGAVVFLHHRPQPKIFHLYHGNQHYSGRKPTTLFNMIQLIRT